jgi:transcriptional regulator of acetoin/glycerol metabolism
MGGRKPPPALEPDELERELQAALLHWRDDARLAAASGGPLAMLMGGGPLDAEGLRRAICEALERARRGATADDELAYRALELAYLKKAASHEQAAERLAVSRTTFYRLLKRGTRGLAAALGER